MNITNIINLLLSRTVLRGVIAIAIFITIWEVGLPLLWLSEYP